MRVSIIGTGYVGLTSGVCLAAKGHDVTCYDTQSWIVETLNGARPHIHERDLPELLQDVVAGGRFRAQLIDEESFSAGDVTIIAVGTPTTDGVADLSQIVAASEMLGRHIRDADGFVCVVVKSTVVPGTTDTVVREAIEREAEKALGKGFGLGMNPEFLREGEAIDDFMDPDRIVLGHDDPETLRRLHALYEPWNCEKLETNTRTAEMVKYANNCLLATQISAVNELANIAAATGGIDIMDVMQGVHLDRRWNPVSPDGRRVNPGILTYLVPGSGFGGSCFPKDVQALRRHALDSGLSPDVLDAVLSVNDRQPLEVVRILEGAFDDLEHRRILILGLAFKPGTDDIRESVSLKTIAALDGRCGELILHDPIAMDNCRAQFPETDRLRYVSDWEAAVATSDAILLLTKWTEYEKLSKDRGLCATLTGKAIIDARRMFRPVDFRHAEYLSIGLTKISNQW